MLEPSGACLRPPPESLFEAIGLHLRRFADAEDDAQRADRRFRYFQAYAAARTTSAGTRCRRKTTR